MWLIQMSDRIGQGQLVSMLTSLNISAAQYFDNFNTISVTSVLLLTNIEEWFKIVGLKDMGVSSAIESFFKSLSNEITQWVASEPLPNN